MQADFDRNLVTWRGELGMVRANVPHSDFLIVELKEIESSQVDINSAIVEVVMMKRRNVFGVAMVPFSEYGLVPRISWHWDQDVATVACLDTHSLLVQIVCHGSIELDCVMNVQDALLICHNLYHDWHNYFVAPDDDYTACYADAFHRAVNIVSDGGHSFNWVSIVFEAVRSADVFY